MTRPFPPLALLALALFVACGSDDDLAPIGGFDAGSTDASSPFDGATSLDAASHFDASTGADAGAVFDASSGADAGSGCPSFGEVALGEATVSLPSPLEESLGDLSCRGEDPNPPLSEPGCFTRCLTLLDEDGRAGSPNALAADLFVVTSTSGEVTDPRFDPVTFVERSQDALVSVGARVQPTTTAQCASGFQLEAGYADLGTVGRTDTPYILRLRSGATAGDGWVTVYAWGIRLPSGDCDGGRVRIPETDRVFPVASASWLRAQGSSSESFLDRAGPAQIMVETLDCAEAPLTGATVGYAPAPAQAGYLRELDVFLDERGTRSAGWAVGLDMGSEASTVGIDVAVAAAVQTDSCPVAMSGRSGRAFPDAITVLTLGAGDVF